MKTSKRFLKCTAFWFVRRESQNRKGLKRKMTYRLKSKNSNLTKPNRFYRSDDKTMHRSKSNSSKKKKSGKRKTKAKRKLKVFSSK